MKEDDFTGNEYIKPARKLKRFRMGIPVSIAAISLGIVGLSYHIPTGAELTPQFAIQSAFYQPKLESVIEEAFQKSRNTFDIEGEPITLNIPFGEYGERSSEQDFFQEMYSFGKGDIEKIWKKIRLTLESEEFKSYIDEITKPANKVIIFNIKDTNYTISTDESLIRKMERGFYPGTGSIVYVLKEDTKISKPDVYNFLYCVSGIGLDCTGFVYYTEKSIAKAYGADLNSILAKYLSVPKDSVPMFIGSRFDDPAYAEEVPDMIQNLRPADIILFMGKEGVYRHSAIIQSVDPKKGVVRYLQCTDWAPQEDRGVHESYIYFSNPQASLKDASVRWTQKVLPTFKGESLGWRDDGDRYRANLEFGGGRVFRLKATKAILEKADPDLYK
jgi:hypothetical protein